MSNGKGYCGICANCVPQIDGGSGFNNCEEAHAAQLAEDALLSRTLTDEELTGIVSGVVEGVTPTTQEISMARELQIYRGTYAVQGKFQGMLNCADPATAQPVFFIEVEGDDWIAAGGIKDGLKGLRDGIYHLYTTPQLAAAGREPVFFVEVQGGEDVQAGRIPGSEFDFNNLPDGINKLYAGPQPMTDEERAPGEITADEELGCLIGMLKYYAAKPDMAAKQLPHLLAVVADAAEQLQERRKLESAWQKFQGMLNPNDPAAAQPRERIGKAQENTTK
jgi:hypothetical protein